VEIRERVPTPAREPLQPANLVAECEGVIAEMEIYSGVPAVTVGQAVRQGDLLVSGVYDSQSLGWRVTRAAGRIVARTQRDFTVEIPLTISEKVYSGDPIVKKTLIFFEKEIKLFKNSGILGTTCDKIEDIDGCMVGEGVSLPISVRTEYCFPYRYRSLTRGYEQAQAVAYHELERRIAQEITEGVLLRKEITPILTEDTYRLQCRVWCLENIAQQNPFTVESLSQ
jgi:similar to stage IV sporulation protein